MKKMLVLALVLVVAGLANAGLVNFVQGPAGFELAGNTFNLKCTITGDTNIGLWSNGATKMTGFAKGADVPASLDASGFFFNVSDLIALEGATDGEVWTLAAFGAAAYPFSGKMLSGVLAAGTTEVYAAEFDGDGAMVGQMVTYNLIPEPMTMVLLGLGGLFLRKKK